MADIKIDYDAVNGMGDTLGTLGDIVNVLDVVFTALATILIATGFGAAIGGKYMSRKPAVKKLIDKCHELDKDLKAAVTSIQNGDTQGANRFAQS
jgi:hypothetical protein